MTIEKIVLFGGTFDPVHLGHATVAAEAGRQIGAEKIIFIPAKRSPLKGFLPSAGDAERLDMISLAIAEYETFEVSDCEVQKPSPSYTLETVRQFQADYGPDALIHWLTGADSVDDLALWHRITDLIDECDLCTMYRAGCEKPDFGRFEAIWGPRRVEKLRNNIIATPLVDISSTEVRRRLAAGEDVSGMLHPGVIEYIQRHKLYRSPGSSRS